MFDTETLIIEVEQRPCLWNLAEKSYNDKFLKQKAWQEVAENCFEKWNNLTSEDKGKKLVFLQKKWKTTRDYYIREKKKETEERSGSAAKKKKSCPYFDLLQFLKVTKQSRISSSNVSSPENTDNESNEQFEPPEVQSQTSTQPASLQTVHKNQPSTSKHAVSSQPHAPRTKIKIQNKTPFQESPRKKFDKNDDDPNRYFLLSFLPEMSKMTERQNFEFRMEIMKALNRVKYQIPDRATQTNCRSDSHSSNQYTPTTDRVNTTQLNEYNETKQYTTHSNGNKTNEYETNENETNENET